MPFIIKMVISYSLVICLVLAFAQANSEWQSYPVKGNANHLWQPSYNEVYGDVLRAVYGPSSVDGRPGLYQNVANSPLGQAIAQTPFNPIEQAQRLPGLTGKVPSIHQMISSSPQLQSLLARYPGAVMQVDPSRKVQVTRLAPQSN